MSDNSHADDVLWRPHPGQQAKFLACSDFEVLYGGSAGAGKTGALIALPLRYVNEPDHHAGIFRRTYPEIEEMVLESQAIYRSLGGTWIASKRQWRWPTGARVTFGNLENMDHAYKYHGAQFTMLLFDELASWPTDEPFIYLQSRLRKKAESKCRIFIRSTCNPTGPGKAWIMRRYGIRPEGTASHAIDKETGRVRRFIPGKISDNPTLAGTEYEKTLSSLPPAKRAALRDGRWDSMEGQFFMHLPIHKFRAQPHWTYYAGFDHGRVHRTAFVLVGVDGDGHQWVVDCHSRSGWGAPMHAEAIKSMLARYGLKPTDITNIAAGHDCWTTRDPASTISEAYAKYGLDFRKAKINRVSGWNKMLDLFGDPEGENPIQAKLTIHPRCKFLTDGLMVMQHDPKRPEDTLKMNLPAGDPEAVSDDEADALRYCLMDSAREQGGVGTITI